MGVTWRSGIREIKTRMMDTNLWVMEDAYNEYQPNI